MQSFLLENIFWLALAGASAGGLAWTFARAGQSSLSPQAAVLAVSRGGGVFVDVRPAAEFAGGHITQARNIPAGELEKKMDTLTKYRAKPVVLICGNGSRSRAPAQQLEKAGFGNVKVLAGGILGWKDAQLPLVGGGRNGGKQ